MPDPDLVIRTSGELRVSNFLLWQAAYAEYHFTPDALARLRREQLARGALGLRDAPAAVRQAVSGVVGRVLIAAPLVVIAILAVVVGGWPMVTLAVAFGVIAMHEYGAATRSLRPLTIAGFAGVVADHRGHPPGRAGVEPGAADGDAAARVLAERGRRTCAQAATVQLSVTLLGVVWIGYGLAFLVALRDIAAPADWGKQLLIAVLVGVWLSDTFAYFGGPHVRQAQAGVGDIAQQDGGGAGDRVRAGRPWPCSSRSTTSPTAIRSAR